MSLISTHVHYSSSVELRVSQEPALPGCFMIKAAKETWTDITIFIPSKYHDKLVRAVDAFNREMGAPYYQNNDEELEAAE